ncbi:energy transducer TonB family protein [Mucilaginibacter auburnensis]|uniref:TonB-like protein n=1 Tax=Mucilaginibacter auburnensis TaxID=1457233 RepID=A0A2H9VR54_9SPHI|nr:energy transducer TonB [Mucilaginibacter auburnensis]PJJ83289.1 hypothetical protein CLV57_0268 [Mucilaginibacter auburnensis]
MAAKSKTNLAKITKYVKGRLNARDRHELERETYDDAFLNEAMDGFEDFAADDHEETIADLKTQLRSRVSTEKNRRVILWSKLAIAASVLLMLGVGYWFLKPLNDESQREKFTSKVKPLPSTVTKDIDTIESHQPAQFIKKKRKLVADNVKVEPSITYKTDTVEYIANAYPVRPNAKIEDMLKKAEGFEIDTTGAVLFNGQPLTKARLNGKDYMGGDVNQAIRNLPADILEKFQVVDDYGDQAGKTGIRTGEPNKVLNLTTARSDTLNEVVVVGYGTQKKSTLVGAVSNLIVKYPSSRDMAKNLEVIVLTDTVGLPRPIAGWDDYKSYIRNNAIISNGSPGDVEVAFYVDASGNIIQPQILRGNNKVANAKALTIIANGPKWRGASVAKEVRLRIFFKKE